MLAGYSTSVVTMRSPHCQSIPLATMLMPSLVFLTKAISSRSRVDHRRRHQPQPLDVRIPARGEISARFAFAGVPFERISAAACVIGATPAWLKKSQCRRTGNASAEPISGVKSLMRYLKDYNPSVA